MIPFLKHNGSRAPLGALLLLSLAALPLAPRADFSLAVVPPVVEKTIRPGGAVADSLAFTNEGNEPVIVLVEVADFGVTESGEVAEMAPGSQAGSLARHLTISPQRVRVMPRAQVFFRWEVRTPEAFDQIRGMVFLASHPEAKPGANQVQVVARMGVPIYIESLEAEPARLVVESLHWERIPERPSTLRATLLVANEGGRNIRPAGYVEVRGQSRGKETTFEFNQAGEPVLPGQRRRWVRDFGPVPAGDLAVKFRLDTSHGTTFESDTAVPALVR